MTRPVSMLGESNTGGEGIPADLICAAWQNGDLDAVVRWYEAAQGDLNETVTGDRPVIRAPIEGYTLLSIVAKCRVWTEDHVALIRWLLSKGADPNILNEFGFSPLDNACDHHTGLYGPKDAVPHMHEAILLLIAAGVNVNTLPHIVMEDNHDHFYTPLGECLSRFFGDRYTHMDDKRLCGLEYIVRALLRAGARLDDLDDNSGQFTVQGTPIPNHPAEYLLDDACFETRQLAVWQKCSILVREVRAAGSYKKCFVRPRKQILTLRSLMLRERATTADAVLKFVFGLPNGPA